MDYTINAQFEDGKSMVWASTDYFEIAIVIKASFEQFVNRNYSTFGKVTGFIISQKVSS